MIVASGFRGGCVGKKELPESAFSDMISTLSCKGVQSRAKKRSLLTSSKQQWPEKGFLEQEEILSMPYNGEGGGGSCWWCRREGE